MLFVDGRPVADEQPAISALDRGFTLGDGVFETMRAAGERVFLWPQHCARLLTGAGVLALPVDAVTVEQAIRAALGAAALPQAVVRLTISRGVDLTRGVAVSPDTRPTVVVRVLPLSPPAAEPLRVIVARTTTRNERSLLSRIKSLNYGDSVLARLEAQRSGADDALLCNSGGALAGATTSNLFVVFGDLLLTPPTASGALPGVTRDFLLEIASRHGLVPRKGELRPADLARADAGFLTNAVLGLRPVAAVDGMPIGRSATHPAALALAAAWDEAWQAFTSPVP